MYKHSVAGQMNSPNSKLEEFITQNVCCIGIFTGKYGKYYIICNTENKNSKQVLSCLSAQWY